MELPSAGSFYSSDSESSASESSSSDGESSSSDDSFFLRDFTGAAFGRPRPRPAAPPPLATPPPLLDEGGGGAAATFFVPFGRPRLRFKAAPSAPVPFSAAPVTEGLLCFNGGGVEMAPAGDAARGRF